MIPQPHPRHLARTLAGLPVLCAFALTVLLTASALGAPAEGGKQQFDIPAGDARPMLRQFAAQAKQEIVFEVNGVEGISTRAVKGEFSAREALDLMLAETGLVAAADPKSGAIAVRKANGNGAEAKNAPRAVAQRSARPNASEPKEDKPLELPTFEVMSSKLLNMDIRRSRDDAQPYVVFEREALLTSGATDIGDFFKQRLTMNTVANLPSHTSPGTQGNVSLVNLRGLGAAQTLILVDGRRAPTVSRFGLPNQPDLNGIPLSAIERIEVLPTTASGIYGGSATGGVINVILRRDYQGAEVRATYDNTVHGDAPNRRVDFSAGLNLEGGKTNVLLTASWSSTQAPKIQDRDYAQRGRARIMANNPGFFLNATNPPLGATPNIRAVGGAMLALKNGTPLNSPNTFVPAGYAGAASDGGAALVANAGRYNLALAPTAQSFFGGALGAFSNDGEVTSLALSARRQFSSRVEAFVESAMSNNSAWQLSNAASSPFTVPAASPNNPFAQNVVVTAPAMFADQVLRTSTSSRRVAGGVIVQLPASWRAGADFTWGSSRYTFVNARPLATTAAAAVSAGTLNVIQDVVAARTDFRPFLSPFVDFLRDPFRAVEINGALRIGGPVYELPAGPATLSFLAEYREQELGEGYQETAAGTLIFRPARSQDIASAYAEVKVPLFSQGNARAGLRELELQLAARGDDYSLRGPPTFVTVINGVVPPLTAARSSLRSYDPTVALRYSPISGVVLRASYGTGFLPPDLTQLFPTPGGGTITGFIDPRRGNSAVTLTANQFRIGGNPDLKPEDSRSWAAGLVFSSDRMPGLRLSVDYIRIEKTDNIATLLTQQVIDNEAFLPGRVTRGANLPGDPSGWAGPISFVDVTAANIATAEVEAFDMALDYGRTLSEWGRFDFFAAATCQTHYRTQLTPSAPLIENVGFTFSNPLKWKASGGLRWARGSWSAGWALRYYDSYIASRSMVQLLNQGGAGRVSSQDYHDVYLGYRFRDSARQAWRPQRLELQVGARNIFDRQAPFDAASPFNFYSLFGDPRGISYYLTVAAKF